jgi:hypothetical protein
MLSLRAVHLSILALHEATGKGTIAQSVGVDRIIRAREVWDAFFQGTVEVVNTATNTKNGFKAGSNGSSIILSPC